MNTQWIAGAAGQLAIERVGWTGVPVLLLHGLGGNASHWNPVVKALSPRAFVALDLRGHGRSEAPDSASIAAHVEDLVAVARGLGLDRWAVAGVGLGGAIALEAARSAPAGLVGVVAFAPAVERECPTFDAFLATRSPRAAREAARTRSGFGDACLRELHAWSAPDRIALPHLVLESPPWPPIAADLAGRISAFLEPLDLPTDRAEPGSVRPG